MKFIYTVLGVFLLLALCSIPVAGVDVPTQSEYQVTPWIEGMFLDARSSESSSVSLNGVERFNYYVASGSKELNVRVSWNLPPEYNSLTLKVFTPKGLLAGEYTDTYESSVKNGIIPVRITSVSSLENGSWRFEVIGTKVSGNQAFKISIQSS